MISFPVSANTDTFKDIHGHWAEAYINKAANQGIVSGYPDGTFRPDSYVLRAEFAKICALAFDLKEENSNPEYDENTAWTYPYELTWIDYSDVASASWYYPYVKRTATYIPRYRLPIQYPCMNPYLNIGDKFLPSNETVRMHAAEALVKIKLDINNIELEVPDIWDIADDLQQNFSDHDYDDSGLFVIHNGKPAGNAKRMFIYTWLAKELDIMQGDQNGYFNPYQYVTRAEVIAMLDRMGIWDRSE